MNLEQLYRSKYDEYVKIYTFRCNGNVMDAEDIVQEAFARALKYQATSDPQNYEKWFSVLIGNVWKDYLTDKRSAGVTRETEEDDGSVEIPDDMYDIIKKAISKTNGLQKECLTHYFINGYSNKEIAEITGCTKKTSKELISRFVRELKKNV